jgi:hypothetical protein
MKDKELDIVLHWKGSKMIIKGKENIEDWSNRCKNVIEKLQKAGEECNLGDFLGVSFCNDWDNLIHGLIGLHEDCQSVLKIPF